MAKSYSTSRREKIELGLGAAQWGDHSIMGYLTEATLEAYLASIGITPGGGGVLTAEQEAILLALETAGTTLDIHGNLYIEANLVSEGELQAFTDTGDPGTIFDNIPLATTSSVGLASFADAQFTVVDGHATIKDSILVPADHEHLWTDITSTPTTLLGYGITDAFEHDLKTWVDKTSLTGATVVSNLTIDALGHPTDWATRDITAADISTALGILDLFTWEDLGGLGQTLKLTGNLIATGDLQAFTDTGDPGTIFDNIPWATDDSLGGDQQGIANFDGTYFEVVDGYVTLDTAAIISGIGVTDGDKGDITVSVSGTVWTVEDDSHNHTIANVDGLQTALEGKTTESYVDIAIAALVDSSPATLDTLNELAAALGDDPNFATTVSTALGNRLRVDVDNQGLTTTQQGYGRTNLGVVIGTDVLAWRTFGTMADETATDYALLASPTFTGTVIIPLLAVGGATVEAGYVIDANGDMIVRGNIIATGEIQAYSDAGVLGDIFDNIPRAGTYNPLALDDENDPFGLATFDEDYFLVDIHGRVTLKEGGFDVTGDYATSGIWSFTTAPTVGGTAVSLTNHNHTGVYAPVLTADQNYVSDAQLVVIGNTSNTNTGDNAANTLYSGLVTMTYPSAGIPLSTGSAWGASITNNSANWNTAYGWGNHALANYFDLDTDNSFGGGDLFITGGVIETDTHSSNDWSNAFDWGDWSTGVDKTFVDALGINATTLDNLNNTDFFRDRGALTSANDLDLIINNGHYGWASSVPLNTPSLGAATTYKNMLVRNDGGQPTQMIWGGSVYGKIAIRRRDSGTWLDWTEFYSDKNSNLSTVNWNAKSLNLWSTATQYDKPLIINNASGADKIIVENSAASSTAALNMYIRNAAGGNTIAFSGESGATTVGSLNATNLSTGYIPYDNGTSLVDSPIYTDGTDVGIGTTSPTELLHVQNTASAWNIDGIFAKFESITSQRGLDLGVKDATAYIQGYYNTPFSYYTLSLNPNGGNILIGTTTDDGTNKLQVSGSVIATSYDRDGIEAGLGYVPYDDANPDGFTSNAGTVTTITAGNGMSFTTITATGTVTMGTPGSLTASTTNSVGTTNHTHAITGFLKDVTDTFTGNLTVTGTGIVAAVSVTASTTMVATSTMTASNFVLGSDARLKKNVMSLDPTLAYKLRPISHDWIDGRESGYSLGFIAQEVQKISPELVYEGDDGMLGIGYAKITAINNAAIQEMNTRVVVSEVILSKEGKRIKKLEKRVKQLETMLNIN